MNMIEKVKQAIAIEYNSLLQERNDPDDQARAIARTALAAMREPSEDMVEAVHRIQNGSADPAEDWQAMIDEALKQPA